MSLIRVSIHTGSRLSRSIAHRFTTSHIPAFRESLVELNGELSRARRYQRPFSVLVLSPKSDGAATQLAGRSHSGGNGSISQLPALQAAASPVLFLLVGQVLRDTLRSTDYITYHASRNQYVILLAECGEGQARQAAERLQKLVWVRASLQLTGGIAEFPGDGLTMEDLLACAEKNQDQQAPTAADITAIRGESA